MPAIIRQALSDRIRRLPALQDFLRDFRTATGVVVEFVGPLGHRDPDRGAGALCGLLQQTPGGCRHCSTKVQELLERSATEPAQVQCDVGLWESAVPLRAGGQTFGYLLVGGYFTSTPDLPAKNRIRHLLERMGTAVDQTTLDQWCARTPQVDAARHAALMRILTLAARHLALAITDNLATPSEQLPPLAQATCEHARRNFTHEVSLQQIAQQLGVTTAHLCRVFHHATGLRFREYLGRLRAERARDLLLSTDGPVTEIAFAAGFQSIAQFNRVFRSVHGASPLALRRGSVPPRKLPSAAGGDDLGSTLTMPPANRLAVMPPAGAHPHLPLHNVPR